MEPLANAERLKKEADMLLLKTEVLNLLSEYGGVQLTGSYKYNLMTWPDIDICLEIKSLKREMVFEIGQRLSAIPNVGTMYFRDEFVLRTAGNPLAMFWCVEIFEGPTKWKIDVLISNPEEVKRVISIGENIFRNLNEENRRTILEIKSQLSSSPDYRIKFRSTDIYDAVLQHGVKNLEEWNEWISKR